MKKIFIVGFLVFVLSVILVSAAWWGVTGNAVDVNTPIDDSVHCIDTDGGTFAETAGIVGESYFYAFNRIRGDKCKTVKGKKGILEYYCKGQELGQEFYDEDVLGPGECVREKVEITFKGKVRKRIAVKWVPIEPVTPVCEDLSNGKGVKDINGAIHRDRCQDGKNLKTYSCGSDGEAVETVIECPGRCGAERIECVGTCVQTSPGVVSVDGVEKKSSCSANSRKAIQYSCSDDVLVTNTVNCESPSQICAMSGGESYCKTLAGTGETTGLQTELTALKTALCATSIKDELGSICS